MSLRRAVLICLPLLLAACATPPAPPAPQVVATDPGPNQTSSSVSAAPSVTFDALMRASSLTAETFTLQGPDGLVSGRVSYDSAARTAIFTPEAPLAYGSSYTASLSGEVSDRAGTPLAPYSWSFSTAGTDTAAPAVALVSPAQGAGQVGLRPSVSASFDEPMDAGSFTSAAFTLEGPGGAVAGTVSYDSESDTALFLPAAPLEFATTYTATLDASVRDRAGNALGQAHSWSFTTMATDTEAPRVLSSDPAPDASEVGIDVLVSATFSEPIDPMTLSAASFTVQSGAGQVSGLVSYDAAANAAIFIPDVPLAYNARYTATLASTVTDLGGNALAAPYSWSFATPAADTVAPKVAWTSPDQGALVPVNARITATFDEPMDGTTVTSASFTVTGAGGAVAGQVSYDAETHTAIFDPEEEFAGEATFTATLRRAITDLAGNALEAEYSWSFSTGSAAAPDASGPTIVSTTPAAGLRGVSPDTAITVTFSEALAPHTLTSSSVRLTRGVKGRISYDPESYTVTFIPYRSLLRPGATYKVMLSGDIADLAGNTFGGYQFTFTTGQ